MGFERGTPVSPDQIAKAKKPAKEKDLEPDMVAARPATPDGRAKRGDAGGGSSGRSRGGPGESSGRGGDRGFNNTIFTRTLYRVVDATAVEKKIEPVTAKLGISDGFSTEVLEGLSEGDKVVKGVTIRGAAPVVTSPGGMNNPFQGRRSGGG
jgi:HlyD family secretion protein